MPPSKSTKPLPDDDSASDDEPVKAKKGVKDTTKPKRVLSAEHLEKLKDARAKAREVQIKNTDLRILERENKAHEKAVAKKEREMTAIAKNKEIKDSLNVVKVEPKKKVEIKDEEEEEEPEPVKVVKKKKPKKPVVIVEASSSDSDDNQVIYIKKKTKKPIIERSEPVPEPVAEAPVAPPIYQRQYPTNPFFSNNFKKY